MGVDTCEHDRTADSCEDCAYQRALQAGLPLGGPPPARTRAAAEANQDDDAHRVKVDTLVRTGPNTSVLVARGDVMPPELRDVPAGRRARK